MKVKKKKSVLYESRLIIKDTLSYEDNRKKILFYCNFLNHRGSKLWVGFSHLGNVNPNYLFSANRMVSTDGDKKALAYTINGVSTVNYINIVYWGNEHLIKLLKTEIQRDDFVLRELTTRYHIQNFPAILRTPLELHEEQYVNAL